MSGEELNEEVELSEQDRKDIEDGGEEVTLDDDEEIDPEDLQEKKGVMMGKLIVTCYDNIPAKVELVDAQPGFSFKHLRLARKAFGKALARRRKVEARVKTTIELQQEKETAQQEKLDAVNREKRAQERLLEDPTRNMQRQALLTLREKGLM